MLTHLQLRDLVIVDQAELELDPGLTALTGETGAGKSIVVDALLLIAGGRAGGDVVRQGAERAEVAASFAALPAAAAAWLDTQSIEHEGEIVVRRVIGADGRSRAYVNGQVVPLQALRELAEFLIEIHGQQEFQRLVNRGTQREMLDEHLADVGLLRAVSQLHQLYRDCRRNFDSLKAAAENRDSRLDLLRYQLAELKAEVTTSAAIEELFADQKRVAGRGRLASAARSALGAAYESDGGSAHDLLGKAQAALRGVADSDPQLAPAAKLLAEALINTQEAAEALRRYLDVLDIDPRPPGGDRAPCRRARSAGRKHRLPVLELPAQLERTERELAELDNAEHSLGKLEAELAGLTRDYRAAAQRLTAARQSAADHLSKHITPADAGTRHGGGAIRRQCRARRDAIRAHRQR